MRGGTKKTIIWEPDTEPPKSYIWVKSDGVTYEWDDKLRKWVVSPNIKMGVKVNVVSKTTAEWNAAIGYIPAKGEVVVYSDYKQIERGGHKVNVPGIKIGSGNAYVQDLMFVTGENTDTDYTELVEALENHINNTSVHINQQERIFWNNKVSVDETDAAFETLTFKTN